jgi:hypothetical protein
MILYSTLISVVRKNLNILRGYSLKPHGWLIILLVLSVLSSLSVLRVTVLIFDTKPLSRRRPVLDGLESFLDSECDPGFLELVAELSSVPSSIWTVFIPRARPVITRYRLGMQAVMILVFISALDAVIRII